MICNKKDLQENFVEEQLKEISDNITYQKPSQSVNPNLDYHAEEVLDKFTVTVYDSSNPDGIFGSS